MIFLGLLLELPAILLCRMFGSSLFSSHSADPSIGHIIVVLTIATDTFIGLIVGAIISFLVGFVRSFQSAKHASAP
jgi:hypothetical protein